MRAAQGAARRSLEWLEPESDEGNVEYKLRLKDPSTMRFQQLVTQMKFRLSEGNGECFYCVGTEFDLESFSAYTASLKGTCASAGERLVCRHSQSACNGLLAFCMPSRKCSGLLAHLS